MVNIGQHFVDQLSEFPETTRYVVGLSGGLDSTVLLHLCKTHITEIPVVSLHINHGLHPDANSWSDHCVDYAAELGLPHQTLIVEVNQSQGESPEDAARMARYAAFQGFLKPGDVLLLAHHLDDQRETLFMRMLRGAGSLGLMGMPSCRPLGAGRLHRPLLDLSRNQLAAYATTHQLPSIQDPSNDEPRFDRNFIRHQVFPLLAQRWSVEALDRVARHAQQSSRLLDNLAEIDYQVVKADGDMLRIRDLAELSPERQANLLRFWIRRSGFQMPSQRRMQTILGTMLNARMDGQPSVAWSDVCLRRYRNHLLLTDVSPAVPGSELTWHGPSDTLDLGGIGRLCLQSSGGSIDPSKLSWPLAVSFRQGGETIRPQAQGPGRDLKKMFQEHGVFPWVRGWVPLIYSQDKLVAVADLWHDAAVACAPASEGWRFKWERDYEVSLAI
ncbi:MAG: tRNA lysidine(34) synthetase TilS [Pseudomonadota bacterium]